MNQIVFTMDQVNKILELVAETPTKYGMQISLYIDSIVRPQITPKPAPPVPAPE